ncbi:FAD-binding domain-containing protein [Exidia glandulosa HHB12029]|uniref:FAD-binding domain-containing protein n=1 Tax=Exidia glandulosa HHB12029 TaxID=1314781 RepID=A0A166AJ88_EXIGL|nr:FAD-binding domain-containing protein [Exidia glandulosa HHB12029]
MSKAISALKAQKVPTFERGTEDYERSVATPNLLYRFSRPEIVVQPETAAHVQAIIQQAKANKIKLTIKCGGHSYAGHSTAFQGISLDLRRMNNVKLDIRRQTITFGAGCQWGHVYKTLINGEHDGYVVNGGRCPFVGVGGYTLGGGLGPFSRSIGMGSDTLKEATVVTADGKIVTVKDTDSPTSDKGRLLWALRGAGGGNFGVVVEMKLAVPKLQSADGRVVAGRYQWFANKDQGDLMDLPDFMPTMTKFYTTNWPERITIDSTWICDLRQNSGNGVRFLVYYDGSKDDFDAIINQNIDHEGLKKQLIRRSLPEASTRFLHETLVAQWSEETVRAFPSNRTYSIYSSFVFGNDKRTIDAVTALIRTKMVEFRAAFPGERVELLATFIHAGGKMGASAHKPTETAYFWRDAVYHMYLTVEWEDKWMERDMRGFLGTFKKELRPYSLQREAAFVNFPDGALPTESHERAYFGGNRDELRRVKQIWDKENFFNWSQGVRLPGDGAKGGGNEEDKEGETGEIDTGNDEDLTDSLAGKQWSYYVTKDIVKDLQDLADLGF